MNLDDSELAALIHFVPLLPKDIQVIAPTTFCKLSLLNYCQVLKTFSAYSPGQSLTCVHNHTVDTKTEVIKQVISRIVDTESVFSLADNQALT